MGFYILWKTVYQNQRTGFYSERFWGIMGKVSFEEEELIQIMTTSLCASFPEIDSKRIERNTETARSMLPAVCGIQ